MRFIIKTTTAFILIAAFICSGTVLSAKMEPVKIAKIMAGCIYHLAKLVTWSDSAFKNKEAPLQVCFLGKDAMGLADYFEEQAPSYTAQNRKLSVKRIESAKKLPAEIRECHILFVPISEQIRMKDILEVTEGSRVLTVGATDRFTLKGGMVGFTTEKDNLKIQVNLKAVEKTDTKISAQFLQHAEIVETERVK